MSIKYLVGTRKLSFNTLQPYAPITISFLKDFSKLIFSLPYKKNYPDLYTLAFWCREKNIQRLNKSIDNSNLRMAKGLVFHITPSNVPTNFAYSLFFSLLNGNSNIVKVPSKKFFQIEIICNIINNLLKNKKYILISKMITVVSYKKDDHFTRLISKYCDLRIVWGGNKTINEIRKFQIKERSIDLNFADRYSISVIDSTNKKLFIKKNLDLLVNNFYNDTYLVDQLGCSSPHLIIWSGKNRQKVRKLFWSKLNELLLKKSYINEFYSSEKYAKLLNFSLSITNVKKFERYGNNIYTIMLKKINSEIQNYKGIYGLFFEYISSNLNFLNKIVNSNYQTLSYYGFNKSYLKNFIKKNNIPGIDRVVPIGQTLNINLIWDGYDLNRMLTREIDIK